MEFRIEILKINNPNSLNGYTNRENYVKNTCRYYLNGSYKPTAEGVYILQYAIFQSKMNSEDFE